jgi:peptide-methionine (S)-S-oxide reductase
MNNWFQAFVLSSNATCTALQPGSRPYCSAQPTGVPVSDEFLKANGAKLTAGYWKKYGPKPGCTINVSNEPVPVEEAFAA